MNISHKSLFSNNFSKEKRQFYEKIGNRYYHAYIKYQKKNPDNKDYKKKVINWLFSKDEETRMLLCSVENKKYTTFINDAYNQYKKNPSVKINIIDDEDDDKAKLLYFNNIKISGNDNCYDYYRKQNEFLKEIIFYQCESPINDYDKYSNYFTFSHILKTNQLTFTNFCDEFSNNEFLKNPLKYKREEQNKMTNTYFKLPEWLNENNIPENNDRNYINCYYPNLSSYYSLSKLFLALIEQVLSVRYIIYSDTNNLEEILSSIYLYKLFEKRNKIILYLTPKEKKFSFLYFKLDELIKQLYNDKNLEEFITKNITESEGLLNYILFNKDDDINTNILEGNTFFSNFFKKNEPKNFIEFFMFIPISKLFTYEDFYFRGIFEKINETYSNQVYKDLILSEEKRVKKRRKKKKKHIGKDLKNNDMDKNNENYNKINDETDKIIDYGEEILKILSESNMEKIRKEDNEPCNTTPKNTKNPDFVIKDNSNNFENSISINELNKTNEKFDVNNNTINNYDINNNILKNESKINEEEKSLNDYIENKENLSIKKKNKQKGFFLYDTKKNNTKSNKKKKKNEQNNKNQITENNNKIENDNTNKSMINCKENFVNELNNNQNKLNSTGKTGESIFQNEKINLSVTNKDNNINNIINEKEEDKNNHLINKNLINESDQSLTTSLTFTNNEDTKQNIIINNNIININLQNNFIMKENIFMLNNNPSISLEKLNNNIEVYYNDLEDALIIQRKIKDEIINYFSSFINEIFPNSKLIIYGSSLYNLDIDTSDLDLSLSTESKISLSDLEKYLLEHNENNQFKKINAILSASVPIIKLEIDYLKLNNNKINNLYESLKNTKYYKSYYNINIEKENEKKNYMNNINIDISLNSTNNDQLDFIKEVLKNYPKIKPLIKIIKKILQLKEMNNSYKGGMSSYCLFLLIYSYIKLYYNKDNGDIIINVDYGTLLLGILLYYTACIDFNCTIIAPHLLNPFIIKCPLESIPTIIEPISKNNAGKNIFKIFDVVNILYEIYKDIFLIIKENNNNDKNLIYELLKKYTNE